MYRVAMVTTVNNVPACRSFRSDVEMTFREIRQHVGECVKQGWTEVIHGAGYGWDEKAGDWQHFKFAFELEYDNGPRLSHVLIIRKMPVDE